MTSKRNKRALSPFMAAAAIITMILASATVVSVVSAQQQVSVGTSKFGTITSLQNGKDGKLAYIASGEWNFTNVNSNSPTFHAIFHLATLNGTMAHKHIITDFKMTGSPTKSGTTTTYNGTATIIMVKGRAVYQYGKTIPNVPISIKLLGQHAFSLWIDPTKTENHFGNTPIYGLQYRVGGPSTYPSNAKFNSSSIG